MRPSWAIQTVKWMFLIASVIVSVAGSPLHQVPKSTASAAIPHSQDGALYQAQQRYLKERDNRFKIVKATHLKAIVPVDIAARSLGFFYTTLCNNARQVWADQLATDTCSFTLGNLLVLMASNVPIPWEFVAAFATKMIVATALGFTGTYDIEYAHESTRQAVVVSMRVLDHLTGLDVRSDSTSLTVTSRPNDGKLELSSSDSTSEERIQRHRQSRSKIGVPKQPGASLKVRSPGASGLANRYVQQKFHTSALIIPASQAAEAIKVFYEQLEDFYDIISMKIEFGPWNALAPMHNIAFKRWGYELSFFSYAAPVPWELIQEVTLDMSHYVRQGFTPAYDSLYRAVDAIGKEIFVSVVFKLTAEDNVKGTGPIMYT